MITKKLEEICLPEKGTIISGPFGSNIGRKYFVEEGIPVIRGNNLSLSLDKFYDKDFVCKFQSIGAFIPELAVH